MFKYLLRALLCCFMLQSAAFAKGIDFSSMNYDFKGDQRILLAYEYTSDEDSLQKLKLEEVFNERVSKELFQDKKLKKKDYVFVLESEVRKDFHPEEGQTFDEAKYSKYLHDNFDAQLKVTVKDLQYIEVHFPGYTYEVPHEVVHSYVGGDGKTYTYVTTWYETVYVPPHTEMRPYCEANFEVLDFGTNNVVWGREVGRDHGVSGPFASSNQGLHDTFDYLLKKFVKDYKAKLLKK